MTVNPFYYAIIALTVVLVLTLFVSSRLLRDLRHEIQLLRRSRYESDWRGDWSFAERELISLEERTGIRLTSGARDMLLIPLSESGRRRGPPGLDFRFGPEYESLQVILRTMREDPSLEDRETRDVRSSLSVIRAFWRNFCNIPPFCDGREGR
jgi:hypothetical protein